MTTSRTRLIQWEDPLLTANAAKGRTGIAYLQAIANGTVPPAPVQFTLGFELALVEEGHVQFRMTPGEHLCNPMATVHGGVACTLLDSAMGSAIMTTLDEKHAYTTMDVMVHLTRAIPPSSGPITAEAKVLYRGSRMATAEGKLLDDQGRLLAHGTTTCLIIDRPTV